MVLVDGCTLWFNGPWTPCCDQHDIDAEAAQDVAEWLAAAVKQMHCVVDTGHPIMAIIMTIGVSTGGLLFLAYKLWFRKKVEDERVLR